MKKALTTRGRKSLEYSANDGAIQVTENGETRHIGYVASDENGFSAYDMYDELGIHGQGDTIEKAFESFAEQYTIHLNSREVRRASFIDKVRGLLFSLEAASITDDKSSALERLHNLVNEYTADGNGEW